MSVGEKDEAVVGSASVGRALVEGGRSVAEVVKHLVLVAVLADSAARERKWEIIRKGASTTGERRDKIKKRDGKRRKEQGQLVTEG